MNSHIDDNIIGYSQIKNSEIMDAKIAQAKQWANDAIRIIITPTDTLNELEDQWAKFNSMIKKNRRESDWKSIELFGMTNQTHYEIIRDRLLDKNIENKMDMDLIPPIQDGDIPVVESYIDLDAADSYYNPDAISYTAEDVAKAKEWATESDRIIIVPSRNLEELEMLWDSFNMMIKKHRRESDWMSQDLFGLTNLKHYEYLKSKFLRQDIDSNEEYKSVIETAAIGKSKKYLASISKTGSVSDIAESLINLARPNKNIYEELLIDNIIPDSIDLYNTCGYNTIDIPCSDMPLISPDDMIDKGVYGQLAIDNYYGAIADNSMITDDVSVKDWFEMYRLTNEGFYTEMSNLAPDWVNKVRVLMFGLSRMITEGYDKDSINARKQSILELGWNPEIEFSVKARRVANESALFRIIQKSSKVRTINLKEFVENASESVTAYNETSEYKGIHPVYVVMTEGKSRFSRAIKLATKSIYSHASISFDHSLSKMYSYAIAGEEKSGFRIEDISKTPAGSNISVYAFFVTDAVYEKLVSMINTFIENADHTRYSYRNLLAYLFNIPYNNDWNMICSQFVDRCLKVAGLDISRVDSSLVSPSSLDKSLKNEKRIYHIYEGVWTEYKPSKIKVVVDSLMKKSKLIKEHNKCFYTNESNYISAIISNSRDIVNLMELKLHKDIITNSIYSNILENVLFDALTISPYVYNETKQFPIQFDKDGNLLIKKNKMDYEAEYAKSHKLLKEYLKSKNLDGIKYELSKLWMMSCMIEDTLHSKKFKRLPSIAIASSAEVKAKAKILNDFQYYLTEVMKLQPSFNFTEYFDNSPFGSHVTKVDATTVSFMSELIKNFIRPI